MRNLVGLFAPLPTPFTDDSSSISEVRLARLARHFLNEGVQGFVVGAATGEFSALCLAERKHLIELTMRVSAGYPVIVHTTCFASTATLDLAQFAARAGAQYLVLTPPLYGEFSDDEIFQFISLIAHHSSLPILLSDPERHLGAQLRERIAGLPTVQMAMPIAGVAAFYSEGTHTDQFAVDECRVSPMVTIAPWRLYPDALAHWLPEPLKKAGPARVVKAALELQGFECGPLRGPAQELTTDLRQLLGEFLMNHSSAA